MSSRRPLAVVVMLILAACTPLPRSTPTPTPTATSTPTPTFTSTSTPPPPRTHTPTPTPTSTPTPTPTPPPSPTPDADRVGPNTQASDPPPRPFDYTVVNPEPPRRVPNATRTFWVVGGATGEHREISARLRVQTEHAAVWVEEGVWHDVRALQEAATFFETQVYPITRAAFGSEWIPGVDNDPHIHILHAAGLGEGVLGYTSAADEFPRARYPHSNEAEMIVVHADQVEVGSSAYYALLARQFQRIIQWYQDRNEERWVKEGLAELAVRLNGLASDEPERAYTEHPDTSLTAWRDEADVAHRGAAYLFAAYFHERFGDEGTRALVAQPLNGIAGFDAVLAELNTDLTFEDLFAEWLAANYLDGEPGVNVPRYGYDTLDLERPAPVASYENYPLTMETSVQQFGADYILLRGNDDLRIQFTGTTTTPLLDLSPHSGRFFWWSNRADESLTTLTRAFDLADISDGEPITLTYWAWYDIEPGYDYATVEVSADPSVDSGYHGGEQWRTVSTPSGTADDPHGNNPGWGYTGRSDDPPGWIQETVDLSSYAGSEILVRFAYLTDEAIVGTGFALDDIAIPAIGYADDVEAGENGWESAGFIRSDNSVPQRYLALLIGPGGEPGNGTGVERLSVREDGTAEWTVPLDSKSWREAVLVISGLAPLTAHPAPYQLTIETIDR